jgi:hypothetical protein
MTVFVSPSWAQSDLENEARTTKLSFEDELIEGGVSSPDLLFILKSKNANYGRLLKLRDHFLPEINETKYDILRGSK